MKKLFLLSVGMFLSLCSIAMDVQTFFQAQSSDGRYYLLDSVRIENVTQGWVQTIDCREDTSIMYSVAESTPTGLDNVWVSSSGSGLISDYQNLIASHRFTVNVSQAGMVSIDVVDVLGRIALSSTEYHTEGTYQYRISLAYAHPFVLSVRTPHESAAIMFLNTEAQGNNSLTCENSSAIQFAPLRNQEPYPFYIGDQIVYIGYSHRQGKVIESRTVTTYQPITDELITFTFERALHSNEGSYVGLIGFNNRIYSYPIDLLTNNNISQYTSYINNLTTANGTILFHAVNSALDSLDVAPLPLKLTNVTLVTFTDGLDVGSWRMNSNYSSSALYLQAVHDRIKRTYLDGIRLESYAIGIKGNDVTDEERFIHDLHSLATDSNYVYTAIDMSEVNKKFRDIAAKIYHSYSSHSLQIVLPAPEPDSRIRLTFDDISDAALSELYLEGVYTFGECGILNDVRYCGVTSSDGATLVSVPDGMFDIFTFNNLETNLGERIIASKVKQWYYVSSTDKWQVNSEFIPSSSVTITEDTHSAVVMLVLDCSASQGSDFASIQNYTKEFIKILSGQTSFSKPSVSSTSPKLGNLNAFCGGRITDNKGLSIIDKGICFSENANMDDAVYYSAGAGDDDFEVEVHDLIEGKTYYYHAYAQNEVGIAYGALKQFTAIDYHLPTVETIDAGSDYYTNATAIGDVSNDGKQEVYERGICYSLKPNPTIDDNKVVNGKGLGEFYCNITGLTGGTTYYVRAYATNSVGTAYGEEIAVTTKAYMLPTITTAYISDISYTFATSGGNVTDDGGQEITERGVCYSLSPNPTINDSIVISGNGLGLFTCQITDLEDETKYYARAYATNSIGTAYGDEVTFTTRAYTIPIVVTNEVTDITFMSAICGGTITDNGGQEVIERGVCYSRTPNPTINETKVSADNDSISFFCRLTELTKSTTYYVRAYAINSIGVAYGEETSFFTTLTGAILSLFSISDTQKVCFSKGNLQYQPSTKTWRFAENQYDFIGDATRGNVYENEVKCDNSLIADDYSGWIDLFGWGTGNTPTNTNTSNNDYNSDRFVDWGTNSISNGGNEANVWRTLTGQEWKYLLFTRAKADELKGPATVCGVIGYIFLPDDFSKPDEISWTSQSGNWTDNVYNTDAWHNLEEAGAVFLPYAGFRNGIGVSNVLYDGKYWSATCYNDATRAGLSIRFYKNAGPGSSSRYYGQSVRLVQDVE